MNKNTNTINLFENTDQIIDQEEDWTFNGASTREITHCYHDYPARMIPQIATKLIEAYGINSKLLFDPYCGTGTSLVEGMARGINGIGTDLNPVARLISKSKTSLSDLKNIDKNIMILKKLMILFKHDDNFEIPVINGINNLTFWFKPIVIEKLVLLKNFIKNIENDSTKLFFQVAFSEVVRESSNTRNNEFKLYRYHNKDLEKFNPDVFRIMESKIIRNRTGLNNFLKIIKNLNIVPLVNIYDFNTVIGIPNDIIGKNSVDIVITSPPYGDSRTTVAYGQYSRFSAAWLDLEEPGKIDQKLMGGKVHQKITDFPCDILLEAIERIKCVDLKRANEVSSFYSDLYKSISNISKIIKHDGYVCYVVGNRKVKSIILPTDEAIRCFFENLGFTHISTFHRSIPNKRMPLKNSPTNEVGNVDNTMTREFIVVLRKNIIS